MSRYFPFPVFFPSRTMSNYWCIASLGQRRRLLIKRNAIHEIQIAIQRLILRRFLLFSRYLTSLIPPLPLPLHSYSLWLSVERKDSMAERSQYRRSSRELFCQLSNQSTRSHSRLHTIDFLKPASKGSAQILVGIHAHIYTFARSTYIEAIRATESERYAMAKVR